MTTVVFKVQLAYNTDEALLYCHLITIIYILKPYSVTTIMSKKKLSEKTRMYKGILKCKVCHIKFILLGCMWKFGEMVYKEPPSF